MLSPQNTSQRKPVQHLAKLTKPTLSAVYARERVFQLIEDACRSPVVWISAPAGAGKTTAVASYIDSKQLPVLWYQIDAGDNDIASFFYHMGLANYAVAPKHGGLLPLLTHEYQAGLPVFTINFFREFFARLRSPCMVVLDNYQDVAVDGNIQEIIQLGLEQIPSGINVVVVSRETPPGGFARSLARDRIALLEWQHLRLTEQESAGIIKQRRKKSPFTHTTISRLHQDTQGWVAGLILLAERPEQELNEYMRRPMRTDRSIFDYFASEIFRRSDNATQEFLLKTAILPAITVSVAQSLTGALDAQVIFDALMQRNLFTYRRVEGSFEYHPLFRTFLIEHANASYAPEQMKLLKQSGARFLASDGDFEAAIALLQEAEDWEGALQIILSHAPSFVAQGRTQTIKTWVENIPEAIRCGNPRALYWQGVCDLAVAPAKARGYLETAFFLFEKQGNTSSLYQTWSAIINSYLLEMNDYFPMLAWLDRYPGLGSGRATASANIEDASVFTYIYALLGAGGDRADLCAYAERAAVLLEREANQDRYLARSVVLIPYYLWKGEVVKVQGLLDRLAPLIRAPNARPNARLNWHMWMSLYSAMTGASDDSQRYANEALAIAGASGIHSVDQQILVFSIRGELCLGNTIAARLLLDRLALISNRGLAQNAYYSHHASLVALHEGDLARAIDEGTRAVEFSRTAGLFIGTITSLIGLAFAFSQSGDADAARNPLAEAKSKATGFQSKCFISYCALCEAAVHQLAGNPAQSLRSLSEALSLAREGNFVTPAYCPRDMAARLYALALENNIEPEYVRATIVKTRLPPPRDSLPERWPWRLRIYSLGRFTLLNDEVAIDIGGTSGSKAQKKPLELLRALIAFGGRDASMGKLAQALWPDTDGDSARTTLRSTLLRLRRVIGEDAVVQQGNYLSLNPQYCWLDIWAFEILCDLPNASTSSALRADRLFELYGGKFLPDDDEPWLLNQRERLRSKALRLTLECGGELQASDQVALAVAVYQKSLEIDPLAEDIYRRLMQVYARLNRPAEALALYQRCRATLNRSLQIEPTAETKSLYREIQQHAAQGG